jgi:hypothetical protein
VKFSNGSFCGKSHCFGLKKKSGVEEKVWAGKKSGLKKVGAEKSLG